MTSSLASCAYRVAYLHCKVCGADGPKRLGLRGNLEYSGAPPLAPDEPHMVTNVVQCRTCGFVYTNPLILLPPDDDRQQYHDAAEYVPYAQDPRKGFEAMLHTAERLLGRRGRLLDVGAGKGEFLALAREVGWDVEGVEPSASLVAATQGRGIPIVHGTLEDGAIPPASVDLVTLHMVLEHVEDPHILFAAVHRVLVPGGLVLIEVPNMGSLLLTVAQLYFRVRRRDWCPLLSPLHWPYHCYGYPLRTIRWLCRHEGFSVVRAMTGDLRWRGFRENPQLGRWERSLRQLVMRLGGLIGRGDVLMVWCRKSPTEICR